MNLSFVVGSPSAVAYLAAVVLPSFSAVDAVSADYHPSVAVVAAVDQVSFLEFADFLCSDSDLVVPVDYSAETAVAGDHLADFADHGLDFEMK